jgi:hypothetical protein
MELKKVKAMPTSLRKGAIEDAVKKFIVDSRVKNVNIEGMYNQSLKSIAQSIIFDTSDKQQFWMADNGQEVMAYALAHIGVDVDDRLTYTISQAWVDRSLRGTKIVKVWWQQIQDEAKRCLCSHLMLPASRNVKPYLRFLGEGFHEYVTLIKKDI